MWVQEYEGYLELRCKDCGEELKGEMMSCVQGSNAPGIEVEACTCGTDELEDKIKGLEELIEETQGGGADGT